MPVTVSCSYCGKEKSIKPSKLGKEHNFCNRECRSKYINGKNNPNWRGGKIEIECFNCGEPLSISEYKMKNRKYHFCSVPCRSKYFSKERSRFWEGGKISCLCDFCGELVLKDKNQVKRSDKLFCSTDCHHNYWKGSNHILWMGGKIKAPCSCCNNDVLVFPSQLNYYEKIYCNAKCMGLWMSENLVGKNALNWQGGVSFEIYPKEFSKDLKEIIRERDEFKCQVCGVEESDSNHDCHHIDYNKQNSSFYNLILLCKTNGCHQKTNVNREYWQQYFQTQIKEKQMRY